MERSLPTFAAPRPPLARCHRLPWRLIHRPVTAALAGAILLSGCGRTESVRHYTVPKKEILYASNHVERDAGKASGGASPTAPTDRMLGAIVPHGSQTWYFKMTGRAEAVSKQESAFRALIESLRFQDERSPPQWTLPESWQETKESGQRTATLSVEVDGQKLEVSVIQLASGPAEESLLDNVNRWRGQMGLAPISRDQLAQETTKVSFTDGTATLVNLVGNFQSGAMGQGSFGPGSFGLDAPGLPDGPPKTTFQFEKPDDWTPEPAPEFCDLAFGVRDGTAAATVTVSQLPGDAGGMVANIDRWRRQIGLSPLEAGSLEKESEELVIQGVTGKYLEFVGKDTQNEPVAIHGWIGMLPQKSLFIKMRGNAKLVQDQRDRFRTF